MTEEIINCDFYNDKICNLFTEYFKFKVECKNLTLCTIEDDTERECPYKQLKRLEFELKVTKADYEASEQENKELKEMLSKEPKAMQAFQISYSGLKRDNETLWGMVKDYKTALEEIREIADIIYNTNCNWVIESKKILDKINKVLDNKLS